MESRVSDEDSIGEKNKWHMMEGAGGGQRWLFGNYILSPEPGKKEALKGILFITNA